MIKTAVIVFSIFLLDLAAYVAAWEFDTQLVKGNVFYKIPIVGTAAAWGAVLGKRRGCE